MEIFVEEVIVPQVITKYKVADKEFTSRYQAEMYMRGLLNKKLFDDIPVMVSRLDRFNCVTQNWYYCKSLDHLLAVVGHYGIEFYELGDNVTFPDWFFVNHLQSTASYVSLGELKQETHEILALINKLEREAVL